MVIRRASFIAILLAAAGCEWKTTSRVAVQVTTPPPRTLADGAREVQIRGARVRVQCPDGTGEDLGSTGAEGSVLVTTRAAVSLACDLAIDHRGNLVALVPVAGTCSREEGGECRELRVRLNVVLRGKASGADATAPGTRCEREQDWVRCRTSPYAVTSAGAPRAILTRRAASPR
jgi:hypothetical protein